MNANAESRTRGGAAGATFVVAASDSRQKGRADYVCDGTGDQEQIQAAIDALPPAGGSVLLLEGTYDIRRVAGTLGGITIWKSNVCLKGCGPATRLVLARDQLVNVIRVLGDGVGNIVIRDLHIDANRDQNPQDKSIKLLGGPFESCGIRVGRALIKGFSGELAENVTIDSCTVARAAFLGIMAYGRNMVVVNNHVEDAGSDGIEVLGGPARIANNYVRVTATRSSGGAIGTDAANDVIISGNQVICDGGRFAIGIYTWSHTFRTMVIGNEVFCRSGTIVKGLDIRGQQTTVVGNTVSGARELVVGFTGTGNYAGTGQGCIVSGNTFVDIGAIKVNSTQAERWPIVFQGNHLYNAPVGPVSDNTVLYQSHVDHFVGCRPASGEHLGSWRGTGAEQSIVAGILQPDVPRSLSVTCTNNAAPAGTVTVEGTDARGRAASEAFALSPGRTVTGVKAFARVSRVTIPAAVGAADTVSVGIADRLGLSSTFYEAEDVYKVKRNNADARVGAVDLANGTLDCSVIAAGDTFAIHYRSNLNTLIQKPRAAAAP
ncbi:MAG: right-handed parallel beta-helix repeat-containing protein [Armatimonadetes bacterium]|nr:right-handed parallel beta-helix repeat-containing protein [Armatimonadota bacterium]